MRGSVLSDPIWAEHLHKENEMTEQRMTQQRFDELSEKLFNKRIGNFLYQHYEASPRWYNFWDIHGNLVMYGGDSTDVIVRIKKEHRELLEPRLMAYTEELVGRHNEVLHEFGIQKFHGVTIQLPFESKGVINPELEVIIHTGSGCCYDQDEIAYEVIAALSGVPVLKALAPKSCGSFIRFDEIGSNDWIKFQSENVGVKVEFDYKPNSPHNTVVMLCRSTSMDKINKLVNLMYDFVDEYVLSRTGQNIIKKGGEQSFKYEHTEKMVHVKILLGGPSIAFCVTVPYCDHEPFARLSYATRVMEMLHENLKEEVEKEAEVV